jgi:phosphopantetheine--protein transferase-like protein
MDMMAEALPSETGIRLRQAVAEFFEVGESEVGPAFSLQGRRGQGSIARAALDSLIRRRVGVTSRLVYSARTYGELEAELAPGAAAAAPSAAPAISSPGPSVNGQGTAPVPAAGGVRCGIDIELIDHLPRAGDCWEDPFYRDHFAPAEIAYCLLQETPALHFAARWCAKEALRKCDGAFLTTALKDIEVVADTTGAPFLVQHAGGSMRRLPHAVSLSHTAHAAVAVVVKLDAPAAAPLPRDLPPAAEAPAPSPAPSVHRGSLLPTLLGLVALGVAIAALVRTFWMAR